MAKSSTFATKSGEGTGNDHFEVLPAEIPLVLGPHQFENDLEPVKTGVTVLPNADELLLAHTDW
jgi:hypothetical protein